MLYTFELYEYGKFVGTKTIEADTELLATVELDCILAEEGESHLEYDLLEEDEQLMEELDEDLEDLEESIKVGRQLVNDEVGYQYYKF